MTKHEISTNVDEHVYWNNNNHINIHFFKFIVQKTKSTIVQNWIVWWKKLGFIFSVWIQSPDQTIHWQKNNWWWKKSIVIYFQFFKWWNSWLYSFLNKNHFKFIIHEKIHIENVFITDENGFFEFNTTKQSFVLIQYVKTKHLFFKKVFFKVWLIIVENKKNCLNK